MSGQNLDNDIKVAIARGIHLFPFRTEKLSLVTPMVLRNSGRVGSRLFQKPFVQKCIEGLFFCYFAALQGQYKFNGDIFGAVEI